MAKTVIGVLLGLLIGAGCRWFDIPVPSPPRLLGALLVVAMTLGYMGIDRLLAAQSTAQAVLSTQVQSARAPTPRAAQNQP